MVMAMTILTIGDADDGHNEEMIGDADDDYNEEMVVVVTAASIGFAFLDCTSFF